MKKTPNYDVLFGKTRATVKSWTRGVPVDNGALEQLKNIAELPFIHKWVAVMPDVHYGIGATVGSVIPTVGAIVPAAVGVDIGCGMMAVQTSLKATDLPENLKSIREVIEQAVPHGRTHSGGRGDRGAWGNVPAENAKVWNFLQEPLERIVKKHPKLVRKDRTNTANHLGTLGSGNHFVELCLDEHDGVWVMLHSGSRGIGNRIGTYFIELAKKDMQQVQKNLPDKNLSYFKKGTKYFNDYVQAVKWAQEFARANRELMMSATLQALDRCGQLPAFQARLQAVNCHHNYVQEEVHYGKKVFVTRKGAVRAGKGDLGIIPGSMGAKSFIVRGLGNRESFESCSHGAGRVLSRTEAKKKITLADHEKATEGVECRKDKGVLDESPAAYKSIDAVMKAQSDLVEIVHTLKQIVCVKG